MSVRGLEASEKRTLAILGMPTAALALAITVVTTYVPVAASEFLDSSVVIGGLIAIEGVLALPLMAITVTIFFVAYFIAYEPYRALYPDLIDDAIAARAQSTQAIWRGAGTGTALIGGGLLVAWGIQAPLLVCGGSILLSIPFLMRLRRLAGHVIDPDTEPPRAAATTAA